MKWTVIGRTGLLDLADTERAGTSGLSYAAALGNQQT